MYAIYNKDGQTLERMVENVKKNVPSNPSLKFIHNFWYKDWNLKWIVGDETKLDFPTFSSSKFFESFLKLFLNEVWNSTYNIIPMIYISHMVCFTPYHSTWIKSLSSPLTISGFWSHVTYLPFIVYCVWSMGFFWYCIWSIIHGVHLYMEYCIWCIIYCIGHYVYM